ncbi:MAG: hypothetical protein R3C56_10175 [Pirellulaceae bacterium]
MKWSDHGANIGTTPFWLDIGAKHWQVRFTVARLSAFVYLSRGDRWRTWAMFVMGTGMVFFGLGDHEGRLRNYQRTP